MPIKKENEIRSIFLNAFENPTNDNINKLIKRIRPGMFNAIRNVLSKEPYHVLNDVADEAITNFIVNMHKVNTVDYDYISPYYYTVARNAAKQFLRHKHEYSISASAEFVFDEMPYIDDYDYEKDAAEESILKQIPVLLDNYVQEGKNTELRKNYVDMYKLIFIENKRNVDVYKEMNISESKGRNAIFLINKWLRKKLS